ncbi:MAG: cytochrome bd-I oxidase subunit CydX [Kiloniellaceae bacterium]
MWYFSWVLGLGLACAFAILNALWFELVTSEAGREASSEEMQQEDRAR